MKKELKYQRTVVLSLASGNLWMQKVMGTESDFQAMKRVTMDFKANVGTLFGYEILDTFIETVLTKG